MSLQNTKLVVYRNKSTKPHNLAEDINQVKLLIGGEAKTVPNIKQFVQSLHRFLGPSSRACPAGFSKRNLSPRFCSECPLQLCWYSLISSLDFLWSSTVVHIHPERLNLGYLFLVHLYIQ